MSFFPRILILTAGFGEGHNSAARNLAEALRPHAHPRVIDPCDAASPRLNAVLKEGYRQIITHTPWLWHAIYKSTDKQDFSKPLPFLKPTERSLATQIERHQPHAIVCTYPLYPYLIERIFRENPDLPRVPVITIVTDSLEINASWTRSPSHQFFVTDEGTREKMIAAGLPEDIVQVTGFPVSPRFPNLPCLYPSAPVRPFKVLFFATRRFLKVRQIVRAVLSHPDTEITLVLGRSVRELYRKSQEVAAEFPGRVTIKGWTKKVPELMGQHHLVLGKAGGATVHEALAARCPMIVHHRVPGQEDGNVALLDQWGVGCFLSEPDHIRDYLGQLLENDAELWREQKITLLQFSKPCGALDCADQVLDLISPNRSFDFRS